VATHLAKDDGYALAQVEAIDDLDIDARERGVKKPIARDELADRHRGAVEVSPLRGRIGLDQPDQIGAPSRRRRRHTTKRRAHGTEPRLPVRRRGDRTGRPGHVIQAAASALSETQIRLRSAFDRMHLITASVGSACAPVKAQREPAR
jgi:hypothetical protein